MNHVGYKSGQSVLTNHICVIESLYQLLSLIDHSLTMIQVQNLLNCICSNESRWFLLEVVLDFFGLLWRFCPCWCCSNFVRVWLSRVAAGLRRLSPLLWILVHFAPAGFVRFSPTFLSSLAAFLSIAVVFVPFAGGAPSPGTGFLSHVADGF